MNGLLLSLTRSGSMSDSLYNWLRSSAGKIPLLYGLPKVHKPEVPLKPIVSFIGSPTYNLSKHLVTILSPLVGKSSSHVRNSFEFASFIAGQSLRPGMVLVSFDVVSLFTKVPVELAVRVAHERLLADTSLAELSPDEVVNLLRFCLGATYLSYRGEVYQQTFGTAMGSSISVTVANLVMEDVEQRALATCEAQPPFWKRYVDDTLTALPKGQIQKFHQHLNSIECSIQFTIEEESEGALPFLDTRITHHDDGTLSTTGFRKKTHTDRYIPRLLVTPPSGSQGSSGPHPAYSSRQDLYGLPRQGKRKGTCHPSVEDEWVPQRTGHQELEAHSTSPPTRGVRHTQGQSHPTVCPTPITDNTEDSNPLGDLHLFSTSPHPPSDFGAPKRSHTPTTADRCGVSDPVQ